MHFKGASRAHGPGREVREPHPDQPSALLRPSGGHAARTPLLPRLAPGRPLPWPRTPLPAAPGRAELSWKRLLRDRASDPTFYSRALRWGGGRLGLRVAPESIAIGGLFLFPGSRAVTELPGPYQSTAGSSRLPPGRAQGASDPAAPITAALGRPAPPALKGQRAPALPRPGPAPVAHSAPALTLPQSLSAPGPGAFSARVLISSFKFSGLFAHASSPCLPWSSRAMHCRFLVALWPRQELQASKQSAHPPPPPSSNTFLPLFKFPWEFRFGGPAGRSCSSRICWPSVLGRTLAGTRKAWHMCACV